LYYANWQNSLSGQSSFFELDSIPCTKLLNLSIESIVAQMVVFLISDILDYIIH